MAMKPTNACKMITYIGKVHPRTGHEGPEVEMYSSTLSSAVDEVGGQRHASADLPAGNTRYPLYKEAGWAPGSVWTGAENVAPTGIRSLHRPARSESLYRLKTFITVSYVMLYT